jgi:DNA polymerase III sliding clamp (beta) subunit (PCNA family)
MTMKILIDRDNLLEALKLVKPATSNSEGSLLTLQMVKFEASAGSGYVVMTADNLSISIELKTSCKVEEGGSICANHATLHELVASAPPSTLVLVAKDDSSDLQVDGLGFEAKVRGTYAENFALAKAWPEGEGIALNGTMLKRAIKRVLPAVVSGQHPVEALKAMQIGLSANKVGLVGTDGFRLAQSTFAPPSPLVLPQEEVEVLLPGSSMKVLANLLSDQPVTMHMDGRLGYFETGGVRMTSVLVHEDYPNWKSIAPQSFLGTTVLPVEDVMQAVKVSRIFARNSDTVEFAFSKGSVVISGEGQEIGENESALLITLDGDWQASVLLRSQFVLESLAVIGEEWALMKVSGVDSPVVVTLADGQNRGEESYMTLIMPSVIRPKQMALPNPPSAPTADDTEEGEEDMAILYEPLVEVEPMEEAPATEEPEATAEEPVVEEVPPTEEPEATADEPVVEEVPATEEPEATADEPAVEEAPVTEEPEATAEEPKGTRKPRRSPRKPKGKKVTA